MFKVEKPALAKEIEDQIGDLEKSIEKAETKLKSLSPEVAELQKSVQLELSKRNLRLQ
jgi:chaperonin cofactor prefoldin